MRRFRYEYGASPFHLLIALASLAASAWAISTVLDVLSRPGNFAIWLAGSVIAHDLVLFPLYSLLGTIAVGAFTRGGTPSRLRIAALNHLRVPAILSGIALLVFFPVVLGYSDNGLMHSAGRSGDIYLGRWLGLTAVLFAGSALLLALRARWLVRTAAA